jgi:hypothetical protein
MYDDIRNAHTALKTQSIVEELFGSELHQKRQLSLSHAAIGVLGSGSLFLHALGKSEAKARGKDKKHTTKQIDRLLSNKGICVWELSAQWVPYVLNGQDSVLVSLDWTSFADDTQSMLSLNVVTGKGVSTPLLWKTVDNKSLKHNRARYEDQLLSRFKDVLPPDTQVLLVADRGFADQKFFRFLDEELKFNYIIRIKINTQITHQEHTQKAIELVRKDGRATQLQEAKITLQQYPVKQVVAVQEKDMKGAWVLASNTTMKARELINCYAKRWKIEPYFRDLKDGRFGYGMSQTHFCSTDRRDRLMLIVALSYLLLVLLGQAGEQLGFDRKLKVNTVKTRTHSLFRQGQFYYEHFSCFKKEEQIRLLTEFELLMQNRQFWMGFFHNLDILK